MKEGFSVHRYVVSNNRKGFYLWAMENNNKNYLNRSQKNGVPSKIL